MGFNQDNKNFIIQKIHSEMKGLSENEKLVKYDSIKEETRGRLKKSYLKSLESYEIKKFYEEAFESLAFFETDYLLLNLFFEKDVNGLFYHLSNDDLIHLNFRNKESLSYDFWKFMDDYGDVSQFLKNEFIPILNIPEHEWSTNNERAHDIIRVFPKIFLNLAEDKHETSYYLLLKLWNHFDKYNKDLNATSTMLYYLVNQEFDKLKNEGIYVNLDEMVNKLNQNINDLFVAKLGYYPLLSKFDKPIFSKGFYKQREGFNNRIELSKDLCKSYVNKSFDSLFYVMLGKSSIICEQIQKELIEKLEKFEIPDSKELDTIINIEDNKNVNRVKQDFLRRLYIY